MCVTSIHTSGPTTEQPLASFIDRASGSCQVVHAGELVSELLGLMQNLASQRWCSDIHVTDWKAIMVDILVSKVRSGDSKALLILRFLDSQVPRIDLLFLEL